ncbi:unnamed protein product [Macrosiphum euphorbiae]|uniref:Uncharacterized protein n=1 Tax=Macrosiphum euphorbiae TaxID=13131 RepID=A0AAV0WRK5_9HEMI|nr:unnamed protein product [Macrosiphum euphorbiae]
MASSSIRDLANVANSKENELSFLEVYKMWSTRGKRTNLKFIGQKELAKSASTINLRKSLGIKAKARYRDGASEESDSQKISNQKMGHTLSGLTP